MIKRKRKIKMPRETENYIRLDAPGVNYSEHEDHTIRTIDISKEEGIKAIYCVECKVILVYLFDKEKGWTMESAKEWLEENVKNINLHYSDKAKCSNCELIFEYTRVKESGMGWVKCPLCTSPVTQKDILKEIIIKNNKEE
jgi:hypothetical protein